MHVILKKNYTMKALAYFGTIGLANRPKLMLALLVLGVAAASLVLSGYSSGAGASGVALTGAPFDGGTCGNCHGRGFFGAAITLQLLDENGAAVTSYAPGKTYTYRTSATWQVGNPELGFQTTAARQSSNININTWGTLPQNAQNSVVNGRNYIEHSTPWAASPIDLPWVAPEAGTGTLVFYTVVNFVNRDGSTSGDQPVNRQLVVQENLNLPVRLLYFKGHVTGSKAALNWATASETNSKHFTIEKSTDGQNFTPIATVASKYASGGKYSYVDDRFAASALYRLTQTDLDGKQTAFNVVRLAAASAQAYAVHLQSHAGGHRLIFSNNGQPQRIQIVVTNLSGQTLYAAHPFANFGNNQFTLPANIGGGIVMASVLTADGVRLSQKALLVR
jgi:hypothetical protein